MHTNRIIAGVDTFDAVEQCAWTAQRAVTSGVTPGDIDRSPGQAGYTRRSPDSRASRGGVSGGHPRPPDNQVEGMPVYREGGGRF